MGGLLFVALGAGFGARAEEPDRNSWDKLPIATEAEFQSLAAELRLERRPSGSLNTDSRLGKLGKLLKLAKTLGVTVPATWRGGASTALAGPMAYFNAMNKVTGLDFSQVTSIAYNRGGSVYLGALFFEEAPLEALLTLVHESRHSSRQDPGHTLCKQGDIPYSKSGCDEWFRADDQSGAYAYHASYAMGLAKHKPLSAANREYLIAQGMSTIGTRFNRVPEFLAVPVDVLYALDDTGTVHLVHPFLKTLVPAGVTIPDERIVRIEFNNWQNGLRLYTESKRIYLWGPSQKTAPKRFAYTLLEDSLKLRDVGPLNNGTHTFSYFLTDDNVVRYLKADPETGKRRVFDSSIRLGGLSAKSFFHGGADVRYFVASDGRLHYYDSKNDRMSESIFNVAGNWTHASAGALYVDIFGIDRAGALYYKAARGPEKSWLQSKRPAVKYVEGTTLRVQLDADGGLAIARYGDTGRKVTRVVPEGARIVDVAVGRRYLGRSRIADQAAPPAAFADGCRVTAAVLDPWVGRGMGLDGQGRLVFEGDAAAPCRAYPARSAGDNWTSIAVTGSEVNGSGRPYSAASLELKAPGRSIRIAPY